MLAFAKDHCKVNQTYVRRMTMTIKLLPLSDRLVVKPIQKEEMTKGGIFIPDTVKEKPQEGEVVAVGPGRMTDDGKRIAMDLKVGDRIIYSKYGGSEIKIEDVEMIILRESDILAIKKE
jgi:chaperonin GroES